MCKVRRRIAHERDVSVRACSLQSCRIRAASHAGTACLQGELPKQEAATLLSHAPPTLLEQALNCMDLLLREALSEAVDSLAHNAPQRRSSFRS